MLADKYKKVSDEFYANTKNGFKKIYAIPAELEGWEECDFYLNTDDGWWVITEGLTGLEITGFDCGDPQEATDTALINLSLYKNKNDFTKATEKNIEKYGLSPRYKRVGMTEEEASAAEWDH